MIKVKKIKVKVKVLMGMIIQCHGKEEIVLLNNISTDIIGLLYVDLQTCPKNT